ncbi:SH3 domain-containing protein [Staphylococcus pettenkoferi]|uniref:SH3 domain-containing protein n=1 Tax=Staphylococcus pettenkoferi TaxID=170573 RepID=UPI000CD16FE1|nr:SH3 domain-containing protein [Staphylococcus pettenkoferi]MCY1566749.1 SH3 domain-containing protein [Staphylococcus pettenkoferi]MCY1585573.1 SH3 domain-containing protein [Staphylococcus pettenkoferi]PNZ87016.1 autolysin [Staphylococcus pettenkoferi]QQC36859.1 SH3 domain-containing protein [Staphylococcus pettenkoferi]
MHGKALNKIYYGQCFDLANVYWAKLFGHGLRGTGAADIPFQNDFTNEAHVYNNTQSFLAKPGDVVVFPRTFGGGYGHVAIVISATLNAITVIEQNWVGGGLSKTEVATRRTHGYEFPMWFIRPFYKKANITKSVQSPTVTKKKTTPKKRKMKSLKYIRDEVKGYRLPNRGYKPKFIVLHNDAGSMNATAENYHNGLVNAPESRLEAGIAHSYISGNTVWQALPESRIGWHTANAIGNKNGYGIEICQSIGASDKVFLANEQTAFQESARMLKKWGLPANRNTVRLHVEFSSTSCPHRSAKLHTGHDPVTQGLLPKAKQLQLKDYFIKQIRSYMDGKVPVATVKKSTSSASNTKSTVAGAWKKNNYGTYYMKEKARFVNGNQPIIARTTGPFRSCPVAYNFQPGGYCDYDEVMLQDGHVWIGYTWKSKRYYLPIRTWNGVAPPHHGVGTLWGSIK